MQYARAVIAAVLATGLVIIVITQEVATSVFGIAFPDAVIDSDAAFSLDATFLLLVAAIIILVVPDAIAYFRRKKESEKEGPE